MDSSGNSHPNTKWLILTLSALTAAVTVAAPSMGISVLFKEISTDLNLDLVQVGLVWSIGSLPAILTALLSGALIDRLGPRRVMLFGIIWVGLTGALRGLAGDFGSLLIVVLLAGLLSPLVTMTAYKVNGMWFPPQQLGLANGIFSMGMALGFMLGSFFTATLLSPWLGGWRHVMFFFGALALLICIPWAFTPAAPLGSQSTPFQSQGVSFRRTFSQLVRLKNLWLVGFAMLGYSGSIQGILGYLPLHLRNLGWTPVSADGAQTLFHAMSLAFVVPITFLSDRLRVRKGVLLVTIGLTLLGTGLLIFAGGWPVWIAVILMGLGRDASMALLFTMGIQTKGVGAAYAGTATGFVSFFSYIGSLIASPIGNSLADFGPGVPFIFWAALIGLAIASVTLIRPALLSRSTPEPNPSTP